MDIKPPNWRGLSHWALQSPKERLERHCCRMCTRCIREHVLPAASCRWGIHRHLHSTCVGKAEACNRPWAVREKARSSARCTSTRTSPVLSTPGTERTLKPWQCCLVLQSLHFNSEPEWPAHQMSRLEGPSNSRRAKGYFPVVQQDSHIQYASKWNGSECPDSTSHHITTPGYYLGQGASPVSLLPGSSFVLLLSRKQMSS